MSPDFKLYASILVASYPSQVSWRFLIFLSSSFLPSNYKLTRVFETELSLKLSLLQGIKVKFLCATDDVVSCNRSGIST